ncbi:hypothetical protein BT96DRAFT_994596 [Gymnopus androsaceus JB14]|uniref:Uncharacterized protein n=1 Tax=Gymnopus androsaceus JB14 TaxID=1447944 RepID=A0A6A4HME6_9AGAR|nr:hypothetical protein BT96DRAFT_994596 [Gymnopus androsaceus JB14]
MASKRYMVLGPKNLAAPYKAPGLFTSMQFKAGGYGAPPLPIHIECPDYTFASFVFEHLQPFFSVRSNWIPVPRVLVENFISTPGFKEVADAVEQRDELIWAVKHGARPGLYLDIAEAIASVDNSKTNSDSQLFKKCLPFCSFTEAIKCQMLNNIPRTAVYTYNPLTQPESSTALLGLFLEEVVKGKSPKNMLPTLCASDPETPQLPSSHQHPSAPSTPRRPAPVTHTQGTPGSYHILFSPNIELRINSRTLKAQSCLLHDERVLLRAKGVGFRSRCHAT